MRALTKLIKLFSGRLASGGFPSLALMATVIASPAFLHGATLNVSNTGSDSGNCQAAACSTIPYAITQAATGDTINVAAGGYSLAAHLNFGAKDLTLQGAGIRGTNATWIVGPSNDAVILFNTAGFNNRSIIRDLILQAGPGGMFSSIIGTWPEGGGGGNSFPASPTIENVIIDGQGTALQFAHADSAAVIRNSILVNEGVSLSAGGTAINNTSIRKSDPFYNGVRQNNLLYAGGGSTGEAFSYACNSADVTYNLVYGFTTSFGASCPGGTGNQVAHPRFLNRTRDAPHSLTPNATGTITAINDPVLTDSSANWTTNQWRGYFVTPDIGYPLPVYFLITSNTQTTLTVGARGGFAGGVGFELGRRYAITDLTYGTNGPGAGTGTAGGPATDIYGTARSANDIGAVAASGTSLTSPATYYVATDGTDPTGTAAACNDPSRPCRTINYAVAMTDAGDTVKVAAGNYDLPSQVFLGYGQDITLEGGYDPADSFATPHLGTRGPHMTRVRTSISGGGSAVYFLGGTNSAVVRNFVFESRSPGYGTGSQIIMAYTTGVSPTIEGNLFNAAGYGSAGVFFYDVSTPIVRNNIVLAPTEFGIRLTATGTAVNNTVVNAIDPTGVSTSGKGFFGGIRRNNVAYGGREGFEIFVSCPSATFPIYSLAFANSYADFMTFCSNGSGNDLTVDPQFEQLYASSSSGLTATTLTDATANWTADEWKGYFVTPNTAAARPQYFMVLSNTATTLTVASTLSLTNYGAIGNGYQITDFSPSDASPLRDAGANTGSPATDIWGTSRPWNATVDIGAVEYEPLATLSINDLTVNEGNSPTTATFTITKSLATSRPVSVRATTTDGTALAGSDYTAATTNVSFGAGETTKTVTFNVTGDFNDENTETFFVNLTLPVNATIADGQGIGTITDNDTAGITLIQTAGDIAAAEGGAAGTYTVVLTTQPAANVVITVRAGVEISVTPAQLTFTPANWNIAQTVTVGAVDDALIEGNHTARIAHVVASNDTAYNAYSLANLTVTLTDNDAVVAVAAPTGTGDGGGSTVGVASTDGASAAAAEGWVVIGTNYETGEIACGPVTTDSAGDAALGCDPAKIVDPADPTKVVLILTAYSDAEVTSEASALTVTPATDALTVEKYFESPFSESSEMDAGSVDTGATLVLELMRLQGPARRDCYVDFLTEVVGNASETETGVGGVVGGAKAIVDCALASTNFRFADYGFDSSSELIRQIAGGALTASQVDRLTTFVAGFCGLTADEAREILEQSSVVGALGRFADTYIAADTATCEQVSDSSEERTAWSELATSLEPDDFSDATGGVPPVIGTSSSEMISFARDPGHLGTFRDRQRVEAIIGAVRTGSSTMTTDRVRALFDLVGGMDIPEVDYDVDWGQLGETFLQVISTSDANTVTQYADMLGNVIVNQYLEEAAVSTPETLPEIDSGAIDSLLNQMESYQTYDQPSGYCPSGYLAGCYNVNLYSYSSGTGY